MSSQATLQKVNFCCVIKYVFLSHNISDFDPLSFINLNISQLFHGSI